MKCWHTPSPISQLLLRTGSLAAKPTMCAMALGYKWLKVSPRFRPPRSGTEPEELSCTALGLLALPCLRFDLWNFEWLPSLKRVNSKKKGWFWLNASCTERASASAHVLLSQRELKNAGTLSIGCKHMITEFDKSNRRTWGLMVAGIFWQLYLHGSTSLLQAGNNKVLLLASEAASDLGRFGTREPWARRTWALHPLEARTLSKTRMPDGAGSSEK